MHIVITGGSGFLGKWVLREFARKQGVSITAVVRDEGSVLGDKVSSRTLSQLKSHFEKNPPNVFLHLATNYGRKLYPALETLDANVILPLRVLEAGAGFFSHSIILDSYYNKTDNPYSYLRHYSMTKRFLDQLLELDEGSTAHSRVILEHMYGPGDSPHKFINSLVTSLLADLPVQLTTGDQIRDFIYVGDVAKALVELAMKSFREPACPPRVLELGTGRGTSVKEMTQIAHYLCGSKSELLFGELAYREDEIMMSVANLETLGDLNWRPEVDLETGLTLTIDLEKSKRN